MTDSDPDSADRRVRRTEQAIVRAFRDLVLSRPYDDIRVADIVEGAGIGRSTFYEHYRNKDQVLTHTISWLFEALADAAVGSPDQGRLRFVMEHFDAQRHLARALFRDRPLRLLTDRLAQLIEERGPAPLRARALAAAQLEILATWLCDRLSVSRDQASEALILPLAGR
ncbi:MAG: TetR/AcrR family transcriptional regulator [Pseudomonadota bacterium]